MISGHLGPSGRLGSVEATAEAIAWMVAHVR
jgi:protease II